MKRTVSSDVSPTIVPAPSVSIPGVQNVAHQTDLSFTAAIVSFLRNKLFHVL